MVSALRMMLNKILWFTDAGVVQCREVDHKSTVEYGKCSGKSSTETAKQQAGIRDGYASVQGHL
jgi:hypothetical protein